MEIELTKDADKMLSNLYKSFINRRKGGQSKRDARRFTDEYFSTETPFASMNRSDVEDTRLELAHSNLLKNYIGGDCDLTDSALVYLENRFKNGLADVLSFLSQFIP